ncbi:MAG: diguanylate cyclase [Thermoleophilaceae bacterium]
MEPSLRRRISFGEFCGAATGLTDRSALARTWTYFFAAGGTLSLVAVLLPHDRATYEPGMLACGALAYGVAVAALLLFDRIPLAVSQLLPAVGTLLISAAAVFEGSGMGVYPVVYAWVAVAAAQLLSRGWAAVHVALVGGGFAAVLLATRAPSAAVQWILVLGTVTMVAAVVLALRLRLEGLVRRLDEAARTDPLTGLLNRRGFDAALEVEIERARRSRTEVSLLIGDLDSFKEVNDRLGHGAGDAALERVSAVLMAAKRRVDVAARLGGEEFALIVPDSGEEAAHVLAERLREELRKTFAEEPVPLTVSFGVAGSPAGACTPAALLEAADRALYRAKEAGRDRSVVAPTTGPA